ncbi:MAG: creatininase family protein [Candidatus Latescibacteria bacterium]|nr:creatininase family protein [Candidatus Latescibacterota bacterium]
MQWEQITSYDFARAVEESSGVGIIPIGVIEAHASHLPLGTDMLASHWYACQAAAEEPVLVFPPYPFGINHESAHLPGSIVIKREIVFSLLENICDEMARQGVRKIVILSGHGGNRYFIPLFVQTLVEKDKEYVVYYARPELEETPDVLETSETGHACESETSDMLHITPDLVKMDQVPARPFTSLRRNQPLKEAGVYSPMDWFAMYPAMYVGDASKATAEKGHQLSEPYIAALVDILRRVKSDDVTPALQADFLRQKRRPDVPAAWDH